MSDHSQSRARPVARHFTAEQLHELAQSMPSRVAGPQAIGGTVGRFLSLTWLLAYMQFKLRFFGSVLGYAWQLVKPLMMFAVLYVVFTKVLRFGSVPEYPVVLLSAIVLFSFFSESTNGAITSIVGAEGLIRKISFPILTVPLASVTSVLLTLFLNFGVVLVFALASGVVPTIRWIEIVPLLLLLYVVSASVAVGLAAFYVRFRDVSPIWEVLAQVLFYASPVIYPIEFIMKGHETLATAMMCNPVTAIIQQIRHAAIDPNAPSAISVLGSWELLAVPMGIVVLLFLFGYLSIRRLAPTIAEEL